MDIVKEISQWTGLTVVTVERVFLTLAVLAGAVGIRIFLTTFVAQRIDDVKRRYHARRVIDYTTTTIVLLALFWVWFSKQMPGVMSFLGLLSAGIAVALHDTIANVAGWLFIMWRKPFQVGDRIEIEGTIGDVIDIRVLQFSVIEVGGPRTAGAEQSTGRILHIPNGKAVRSTIANYDTGFSHVWDEIPILVTFESDWQAAKDLLQTIINRHVEKFSSTAEQELREAAQKYMIYIGKLTPIVYTSVEDSGVKLALRYMVRPRQIRGIRQAVFEDILAEFAAHDHIDFAYPTVRYYQPAAPAAAAAAPQHQETRDEAGKES